MASPELPPKASFAGIPLLTTNPVGWAQTIGVNPHTQVFQVHEDNWEKMLDRMGQTGSLVITPDGGEALTVDLLIPVREVPTTMPFHRSVMIADIRYRWQYEILTRSYNIPRKSGDRRLVGGESQPVPTELLQSVDIYTYAYYSLKPEGGTRRKWTPRGALEDALAEIAQKCGHPYRIDGIAHRGDPEQNTIEGVDVSESAHTALSRIMHAIPRARVFIDYDGTAVVFDGSDRGYANLLAGPATTGAHTEAGEITRVVDLSPVRPEKVHVYFSKEIELRFDSYEELDGRSTTDTVGKLDSDAMLMENVVPLPDPTTTIDDQIVTQGTYVPFHKAVAAWNNDLANLEKPKDPPALTLANIRKYWFLMEALWTPLGNLTPNAKQSNWTARIAAIRTHYRQTYQLPEAWRRRIKDMKPYRVGILDPFTGTKAPAQAWSQYCIEPTIKSYMIAGLANNPDLKFYWINVDGYPGFTGELYQDDAGDELSVSPAVVSIKDADLGILGIDYRTDPHGMRAQIHPSQMANNTTGDVAAPSRDLRDQLRGIMAVDGRVAGAAPFGLSSEFRVAVVLTAMPAEPNDESRLYKYTVNPDDIKGDISDDFDVQGGRGPDWHIVVPPSLSTAWYAWAKTVEARIGASKLFGFDNQRGVDRNEAPGYELMRADDLIPGIAKAVAMAVWADFVTQREGSKAAHWSPSAVLGGTATQLVHQLMGDGRMLTRIMLSSARRHADPVALIPQALRPLVLGRIPEVGG